jgi:GNAT superfamily N-acetyltransferase
MKSPYRIREVDAEEYREDLEELHTAAFEGIIAPMPDFLEGHWWLAFEGKDPVAFAGLTESSVPNAGYLARSGVLPTHRGRGLQKRLIQVRIAKARRLGWEYVVTDTTLNPASSNSLIARGFRLFTPDKPWGWPETNYWRRTLRAN